MAVVTELRWFIVAFIVVTSTCGVTSEPVLAQDRPGLRALHVTACPTLAVQDAMTQPYNCSRRLHRHDGLAQRDGERSETRSWK